MLSELVGSVILWLTAIVGQAERLASQETITIFRWIVSKKQIGTSLMVIATLALGWQAFKTLKKQKEIDTLQQVIRVSSDTTSRVFNEASGGVAIDKVAYIVDDEKPTVFKFRLEGAQYALADKIDLKENGNTRNKDDVDDLEAVASSDGKLYLITSHSNTHKGKMNPARQRLLEVSLGPDEGKITRSTKPQTSKESQILRNAILKQITKDGLAGNAPDSTDFFDPILCRWDFESQLMNDRIQNPTCVPIPKYEASKPTPSTAKIELLLLPPPSVSNKVFMFLDTDGKGDGGQLSYSRTQLGLKAR